MDMLSSGIIAPEITLTINSRLKLYLPITVETIQAETIVLAVD